jgi:AraC family transcriptional regulator
MTTLYIKNMVCDRCKLVVTQELEKLGLHPQKTELGQVEIQESNLSPQQQHQIDAALKAVGFERIDDRKARLIETVKNKVRQTIHHSGRVSLKVNWSTILSEEVHYDYGYISSLFSSMEGTTLEHYIIRQKIERAKELLFYDELTLTEIADVLGYSSVAHLSAQFKKVTGLTPSDMKKFRLTGNVRKPIDAV